MADTSLMYWQEKLGKTQPRNLRLTWEITGTKTVVSLVPGIPVLATFDAIASQAVIDDFLGTSSEFTAAQFDATSEGTDAFAVIVNMTKQVDRLLMASMRVLSGTNNTTEARTAAKGNVLNATTLATEAAKGSFGNMAAKFVSTGIDALTSGLVIVEFHWVAK